MILLIAEHAGQVKALQAEGYLDRPEVQILAATAGARYACEQAQCSSVIPEDFYEEQDVNRAGEWVTGLVNRFEQRLDPQFVEWFPGLRPLQGIGPIALSWWELRRLIAPHASAVSVLGRVLRVVKPSLIVCFAGPPPQSHYLDSAHGSPWPGVLRLLGNQMGIQVEERPEPVSTPAVTDGLRHAATWLKRTRRWAKTFARWVEAVRLQRETAGAPILILGYRGYEMAELLPELLTRGARPVWLWDAVSAPFRITLVPFHRHRKGAEEATGHASDSVWPRLAADPWLAEAMTFEGVSLSGLLAEPMKDFCDRIVPDLVQTVANAESLLDFLQPAAILTEISHRREHTVQRLAALRGIPTIEYSHGVGPMGPGMETSGWPLMNYQRGWRWASHVLVQGDGVRDYMEKCHGAGARTIPVGSAYLDRIKTTQQRSDARRRARRKLKLDGARPIVLYVPMVPEGVVRYPPHRARPSNRQWLLEERILAAAGLCPGIELIVKAYPRVHLGLSADRTPLEETLRDRSPTNCRVVRSVPFAEVLAAADLFIADCPTLVFYEMLLTDRPIVLCGWENPWPFSPQRWHPAVEPMWKDRIVYLETLEDVDKILPDVFGRLPLPPVSDQKLLRRFGTHRNDGLSVQRAREAVQTLIMETETRPAADRVDS